MTIQLQLPLGKKDLATPGADCSDDDERLVSDEGHLLPSGTQPHRLDEDHLLPSEDHPDLLDEQHFFFYSPPLPGVPSCSTMRCLDPPSSTFAVARKPSAKKGAPRFLAFFR